MAETENVGQGINVVCQKEGRGKFFWASLKAMRKEARQRVLTVLKVVDVSGSFTLRSYGRD